jgi:hypothetical protein
MSATTMAVATTAETVDAPPGSRVGHAALPVSIAVVSVRISGLMPSRSHGAGRFQPIQERLMNLKGHTIMVSKYLLWAKMADRGVPIPQSGHDSVLFGAFRDGENFPEN